MVEKQTVIDWDNMDEAVKRREHIEAYCKHLAKVGLIHNLAEENIFLCGIAAVYEALGRADQTPCYVVRPGLAHDSAFSIDYYDPEHPLRHCKECYDLPKMIQIRVIDPDEVARKVKKQKGMLAWHCSKCGKQFDQGGKEIQR